MSYGREEWEDEMRSDEVAALGRIADALEQVVALLERRPTTVVHHFGAQARSLVADAADRSVKGRML